MRLGGKEINDECKNCGDVLVCELTRQGHGIGQPRTNITQMVECQISHKENNDDRK